MIATQPDDDPTEDSNAHLYEQSLGRLASALGGDAVLPPTFQYIPDMLMAHNWRPRHAGLMAIAVIVQGTFEVRKRIAFNVDWMLTSVRSRSWRVSWGRSSSELWA